MLPLFLQPFNALAQAPSKAPSVPDSRTAEGTSAPATAEHHAAMTQSDSLEAAFPIAARPHFTAALLLFEAGDFRSALLKFQLAYDLSQDPRLLWDIAICEKSLGHYARALPLVRRYLAEAASIISDSHRNEAAELAELIANFVGPVRIECSQPGATVYVDEEELGKTPLVNPMPFDMGNHKVTVRKRGFREVSKSVRVLGPGPEQTLYFRLERDIPAATLEINAGHDQTITLDGLVVGHNRWEGLVSPTKHVVKVSGAGYKPKEVQTDLTDGRRVSIWVVAQPLEPADRSNHWPLIAVIGSVTAVVAVVAYYGLRDQPRANSPLEGSLGTFTIE